MGWEVQRTDGALGVVDTPNTNDQAPRLDLANAGRLAFLGVSKNSQGELGHPDRAGTDEEMIRNEDDRDGGDG